MSIDGMLCPYNLLTIILVFILKSHRGGFVQPPKKISFAAEQLKRQPKKKTGLWVSLAIVGIVIVIGGYSLYVWYGRKNETVSPVSEELKSIAVLPFENLSDDKEDEYFSDGITDDILLRLSKIHDLKVISRTSVMRYKDTDKSLPEIGKELDVAAVYFKIQ